MGVLPPPVTALSGSEPEGIGEEARWIPDGFFLFDDLSNHLLLRCWSLLCGFGAWWLLNPELVGQAPPRPTPKAPTPKAKSHVKAAAKNKPKAKQGMKRPAAALKPDSEASKDEAVEEVGEVVTAKKTKNEDPASQSADACPDADVPASSGDAPRKKPASAKSTAKASSVMRRPASAAAAPAPGDSDPGQPLL